MIRALKNVGIEGKYLNKIKAISNKHIANIVLKGEKEKPYSLRNEIRVCTLSSV
jgi:nitrogen regulatory protein PII-like uncharacterized protein